MIIDIVQGLVVAYVASCMTDMGDIALCMIDMSDLCFGCAVWKVILFPVYVLCLVFDFRFQMRVLKPKAAADTLTAI